MAPSSPKRAPEAPTWMVDSMNKADSKLPPIPEMMYSGPILTIKGRASLETRGKKLNKKKLSVTLRIMCKENKATSDTI